MAKARHHMYVYERVLGGRIQINEGSEIIPRSGYERIIAVDSGRYAIHLQSAKPLTFEDRRSAVEVIVERLKHTVHGTADDIEVIA